MCIKGEGEADTRINTFRTRVCVILMGNRGAWSPGELAMTCLHGNKLRREDEFHRGLTHNDIM